MSHRLTPLGLLAAALGSPLLAQAPSASTSPSAKQSQLARELTEALTASPNIVAARPSLGRFLDRHRGQDLAPVDYAPSLYLFLNGDYEGAVRGMESYFQRHARLAVPEHSEIVGQVYLCALREEAAQPMLDVTRVQSLALRALDLQQPATLVGDTVHAVLQRGSSDDVARVRGSLVRRLLADQQLDDSKRDDALRSLYRVASKVASPAKEGGAVEGTATSLAGRKVDLSALRGRVVLVHFWASWCPISTAEAPEFVAAYARYHTQGLAIIGVAVDTSTGDDVRAAARALGFTWDLVHENDFDGAWAQKFAVDTLPRAFLLDRRGIACAEGDAARGVALQQRLATLFAN